MKKTHNIERRRTVTAGGGLCAFAGFTQGLVDHALLGNLDQLARSGQFQLFLNIVAEQVKCEPLWPDFVAYLRQHLDPPGHLQLALARVLRSLVVELRRQGKAPMSEGEKHALQAAFSDYLYHRFKLPMLENFRGDDIYRRHSFVTDYFSFLIAEYFQDFNVAALQIVLLTEEKDLSDEQRAHREVFYALQAIAKEDVVSWYMERGYQQFSEAMANDIAFAGDLELKILAQYWCCTFKVERLHAQQQFTYTIYGKFGQIATADLSENSEEILLLKNLRIVDRSSEEEGMLNLIENTADTVQLRLADIPHAQAIIAMWRAWVPENARKARELREAVQIPEEWSEAVCSELLARDILERTGEKYYFTEISVEVLYSRLCPIKSDADRKRLFLLWQKNYQPAPEICCANDNAIHWEYYQPQDFPWRELITSEPRCIKSARCNDRLPKKAGFADDGFFGSSTEQDKASGAEKRLSCARNTFLANKANQDVYLREIQNDARDTLDNLKHCDVSLSEAEKLFYARAGKKLEQIIEKQFVSSEDVLYLLCPEELLRLLHPGLDIEENEMLGCLQTFRGRYYLKLLSTAYLQLCSCVKVAVSDIEYIINLLKMHHLNEVENAFINYAYVCKEILFSYGEGNKLPAVADDSLLEDTEQLNRQYLDMPHTWSFCDSEYQKRLTRIRNTFAQMRLVLEAACLSNIATAIAKEMVIFDFDTEYEAILALIWKFSNCESIKEDDIALLDSIHLIIENLSEYPILNHTLNVFIVRAKEEFRVLQQHGLIF